MVKRSSPLLAVLHCVAVAPVLLVSIAVAEIVHAGGNAGLSYDFYQQTCPQVESIMRKTLLPIFMSDPRSPAAFLRLFFHDCLVQGCDASILLDNNSGEMASGKNFGIRDRELIQLMNSLLEVHCPGAVSCADIIALAAREAVAFSGGPCLDIPLGRKDATVSSFLQADAELPSAKDGVDRALAILSSKGMSIEESVAILGAHSIGVGHCLSIVHRLYDREERHKDYNMDYGYEIMLRLKCPFKVPSSNETFVANDLTSLIFDNQYYKDIVSGRGLFTVDSEIALDPRTAPFVKMFAEDQEYFFRSFSMAFVRLSSSVILSTGEIRRVCNRVNSY
ncbi:putative peroxidase [Dioscorea sansibarensis]